MTLETLNTAIAEAKRFIERAQKAKKRKINGRGEYVEWCSKESAAAKRASMDLTRALAELRYEDIILICTGTAHARRYPAKKGERRRMQEEGTE